MTVYSIVMKKSIRMFIISTFYHYTLIKTKQLAPVMELSYKYIESYLSMLDDLIAILTGNGNPPPTYPNIRKAEAAGPRILHREV